MREIGRAPLLLVLLLLALAGCASGPENGSGNGVGEPTTQAGETTARDAGGSAGGLRTVTIEPSDGEPVRVRVEIADDDAERARGLMERTALGENRGMLFVFEREQTLSFWMKDTLIPLSIAYIDAEGQIVDIQDMEPLDTTPHPSAGPARYALEVNQGFFRERDIEVGDGVELPE